MNVTLDDLFTPLTKDEAEAGIYDILTQLGVAVTGWKPGAVVRAIVSMVAILVVACSALVVLLAKGAYRSTATGSWLRLHAQEFYGLTPIDASFATGALTLTNVGGGVYNPAALSCVFQNSSTGKTYRNADSFHLGAGTLINPSAVDISIVAVEAGSESTSVAGEIDTVVTTMLGVTCTNADSVVGIDAETDAELAVREDAAIDALSPNGPAGAYLAAARTATRADGSNIGVTRCKVTGPSDVGEVTVVVATASGGVTGDVGDPGDDLDYVNHAIQTLAVPLGITADVISATALTIPVTYTASVYSSDGRTTDQLKTAIAAFLTTWFSQRNIGGDGGKVYQNAIRGTIMAGCAQEGMNYCFTCTVSTPGGDTTVTSTQVPVLGTVTGTVTLVTP